MASYMMKPGTVRWSTPPWAEDVGNHVTEEYANLSITESHGGFHEFALLDAHYLGPNDSGKSEPTKQSEGEKQGNDIRQTGREFLVPSEVFDDPLSRFPRPIAQGCLQNDNKNQEGNGQKCVYNAHHDCIRLPSGKARNCPVDNPYGDGNGGGDETNQNGNLPAIQDAGEKVAPSIGAEPVLA